MDKILHYRPNILRWSSSQECEEILSLKSSENPAVFHDTIEQQLYGLIETMNPSMELSAKELEQMAVTHLDGIPLEEYGVYVHYPWLNKVVHLLDEEEFTFLRTNRNKYKITPKEQDTLAEKKIGLVGLSVGYSVAVALALERGFGELRIADFDELELSNLNRIRTNVFSLGLPKTVVTARAIAELDPFLKISCFPDGLTNENMSEFMDGDGGLDLLIDECDSLDIKIKLREEARTRGIPVLMETSDRGMMDVERFDKDKTQPILHGLVDGLDSTKLAGLTNEEKIPYVIPIIGLLDSSLGLKASMVEIERSISTWPQLGADVISGGGVVANVSRRLLIGHNIPHGRYYVELDKIIPTLTRSDQDLPESLTQAADHEKMIQNAEHLLSDRLSAGLVDQNVMLSILQSAVRAPSAGNNQPWLWHQIGDNLVLFLDTTKHQSIIDGEWKASLLALGAAAENVILAASKHGMLAKMTTYDIKENDVTPVVAIFNIVQGVNVTTHELYEFIDKRITNRLNEGRVDLPEVTIEKIRAFHRDYCTNTQLSLLVEPVEIQKLRDVLGRIDKLTLLNETGHRDLHSEFAWQEDFSEESGINVHGLGLTDLELAGLEISRDPRVSTFLRAIGGGERYTEFYHKALESSSAVLVLSMVEDRPMDYFRAGMDLQSVWLQLTSSKVSAQPITGLTFLCNRLNDDNQEVFNESEKTTLKESIEELKDIFKIESGLRPCFILRLSKTNSNPIPSNRKPLNSSLI